MTPTPPAAEADAQTTRPTAGRLVPALCLVALAALLLFPGLGATALTGEDEARYAGTTRNMLESGDWTVPQFNGMLRAQKPILIYWMMGGAFKLFGVSEFTARLWSALTSLLLVLTTFLFAAQHLGNRAALIAGLFLAVSPATFIWGRMAVTDIPLTLLVTVAILSLFQAAESPPPAQGYWHCTAAVALGLGTLMKGPVALVLTLLAFVPYLVLCRRLARGERVGGLWAQLRQAGLLWALLLFLAIAGPWYIIASLRTHGQFAEQFFVVENLSRYFRGGQWLRGGVYYYIPTSLAVFLPWSGFLPYAIWQGLRARRHMEEGGWHRLRVLCASWFVMVFLFFSFSRTKLPSYVLPLAPAAAILAAMQWEEWRAGLQSRRSFWASSLLNGLLLAAATAFLLALPAVAHWAHHTFHLTVAVPDFAGANLLAGGGLALGLLAWGALSLWSAATPRRVDLVPWALAASMALTALAITGPIMRALDRSWQGALSRAAQKAGQMAPPEAVILAYGCEPSPVVYYSHRQVQVPGDADLERLGKRGLQRELWIVAPLTAEPRLRQFLDARRVDSEGPYGVFVARPSRTTVSS